MDFAEENTCFEEKSVRLQGRNDCDQFGVRVALISSQNM